MVWPDPADMRPVRGRRELADGRVGEGTSLTLDGASQRRWP
jgi:hypothetical protein